MPDRLIRVLLFITNYTVMHKAFSFDLTQLCLMFYILTQFLLVYLKLMEIELIDYFALHWLQA
jgi:hypothetical protein